MISAEEARAKFAEQLAPTFSRVFPDELNKGETKIGIYEYALSDNWRVDAVNGKVLGGMIQPVLEQNEGACYLQRDRTTSRQSRESIEKSDRTSCDSNQCSESAYLSGSRWTQ